jgi:Protein of unknown function (DUF3179)
MFVLAGAILVPALSRAEPAIEDFFLAAFSGKDEAEAAMERIESAGWHDGYAAIFVDLLDLLQRTSFARPRSWIGMRGLTEFLERQTGQGFGTDIEHWRRWAWSLPYEPHPAYGAFKGVLYSQLDPGFAEFFKTPLRSLIRLDEIQWGGVSVNGIPPLDHPETITGAEADYLDDRNIVFGLYVDGNARAYPKRILAWHELALDRVGGRELTIVYCTLCGTVIPFESEVGGRVRKFGTSGLLYQSNKLMFDEETKSLWSSLTGTPVVGPLAGSDLELVALPVVTTTWGEWRTRHPDTTVLSLNTGYRRDYREGAAYRDYFASDDLMFDVSLHDERLANKAEVLALSVSSGASADGNTLAIDVDLLLEQRILQIDDVEPALVVITDDTGANRVYASGDRRFGEIDAEGRVVDTDGRAWIVAEDALVSSADSSLRLARVPAHRSFWFGWVAQHPDTRLIR